MRTERASIQLPHRVGDKITLGDSVDRLQEIFKVSTDSELAKILGVKPGVIRSVRKRNAAELFDFICSIPLWISLDYLFVRDPGTRMHLIRWQKIRDDMDAVKTHGQ